MPWYSTELTSEQIRAGEELRLQRLFGDTHIQLGAPIDVAMFSHWTEDLNSVILSVTPEVENYPIIIRLLNLQPSTRPPADAAFSVGHQEVLARFRRNEI
jgi:hypothetical protein